MPKSIKTKRAEAYDRQTERNKRTPKQQLALLDRRPGEAKAERARLTTL